MKFEFSSEDNLSTLHPNIVAFIPRYVANRKEDYQKLRRSVEKRDFDAIRDYCHKVVGTARSYHFFRLEEITKRLQVFARNGDIESVRELMPAYDEYIQGLFEKYLPKEDGQKK